MTTKVVLTTLNVSVSFAIIFYVVHFTRNKSLRAFPSPPTALEKKNERNARKGIQVSQREVSYKN